MCDKLPIFAGHCPMMVQKTLTALLQASQITTQIVLTNLIGFCL